MTPSERSDDYVAAPVSDPGPLLRPRRRVQEVFRRLNLARSEIRWPSSPSSRLSRCRPRSNRKKPVGRPAFSYAHRFDTETRLFCRKPLKAAIARGATTARDGCPGCVRPDTRDLRVRLSARSCRPVAIAAPSTRRPPVWRAERQRRKDCGTDAWWTSCLVRRAELPWLGLIRHHYIHIFEYNKLLAGSKRACLRR